MHFDLTDEVHQAFYGLVRRVSNKCKISSGKGIDYVFYLDYRGNHKGLKDQFCIRKKTIIAYLSFQRLI